MNIVAWVLMAIGAFGFFGIISSGGSTAAAVMSIAFFGAGNHLRKKAKKNKQ